jgi:hypothetical protein
MFYYLLNYILIIVDGNLYCSHTISPFCKECIKADIESFTLNFDYILK